jgi:SAM-dependent methyltransferase
VADVSTPPTQRDYWSGKAGEEWARHAERIDAMLGPVTEVTLRAAAFQTGDHVLDIGCGAGETSVEIARRVAPNGSVVGVDLSPQLLDVARDRARDAGVNAEFVEADAGAAHFGKPFDAAFSRFGVMFFEAPSAAFAHIRKAMQPRGRLAFTCWRPMAENPWASIPIATIEPMLKAPLPRPDPDAPGPYGLADPAKIERVLGEAGWRDVLLARWDGDIPIGGSGSLEEIASFVMKIGPCARAIADQELDAGEAQRRLMERLAPLHVDGRVMMPSACWIVTARA